MPWTFLLAHMQLVPPNLIANMYRGYNDHRIMASNLTMVNCDSIADARRLAWCLQSGMTTNGTLPAPRNVLITSAVKVMGKSATTDHARAWCA